mgnify:FL=1
MGVKEWLWTASGEGFCLFHAADPRGRVELETMLGTEFAGVLSSDDFSVYNGCSVQAQQKCLAHLLRHFKKVFGLPGNNNNATVATVFIDLINAERSLRLAVTKRKVCGGSRSMARFNPHSALRESSMKKA